MKSSLKLMLLASVALTSVSVGAMDHALAQDAEEFSVEEVVVTARRRSESLKDVPGTVTAITQSQLESAGVSRAEDFIAMTPGVTMVNAAEVGDTQVNIRGINGARDAENSFAFILDGILYNNPAAFNREYTDLQQIEIFKGPQGAIYGRNAAAGAVIVTTERPGVDSRNTATLNYGQDNTMLAKGSVTFPIADDKAYVRLSGDWRKSDGFFRNIHQDDAAIVDAYEGHNLNMRVGWDVSERLSLDLKARHGRVDGSAITFNSSFKLPVFAAGTNSPAAFQDVNDYDFRFQPNIVSDNDQEAWELSGKFDYEADNYTITGWMLYSDISNNLIADGSSAAFGFYNGDSACQDSVTALNAAGTQLLAPQFIGESPVGVIFAPNGSFLGAFTPTTCDGIQEQVRNQKDLSAELRIASSQDADIRWMAGVYYLDIDREVGVSLNRDSGETPIRGLFQYGGPNATASLTHDAFDSEVISVFGQMEVDATDRLEASLAVRYDTEKRSVSSLVPTGIRQQVVDLNFDGVFNDPLNPALSSLINTTGTIPDKSETFKEFEPKLSLTYDLSDDTTLFASWGVGFKAGGFNNSGSAATVNIFINGFINGGIGINFADDMGVPLPTIEDNYRKETSQALEAGFKTSMLNGRVQLNGAAYHTKITDMQFFEFYVGSFGLLRTVSNIDKVDVTGFELGMTGHVNENFRIYGGGNITNSEIKANASRPDTVGNKSPYTADYTFNVGADFDYPVKDDISIIGRVDAQLVGPTWFHTVQAGQRPTIFNPLFELGFGAGAGGLGIADYSVARRDSYKTIDLRFGLSGDGWSLTAYAKNVTDERILEEVIPAPEFGGSFDHPGARRRLGVELSATF